MKKRRIFFILFVFLGIILLVTGLFLLNGKKKEENFNEIMIQLNHDLAKGSLDKVKSVCGNYKFVKLDAVRQKRLLNRIYTYSLRSKDFTCLEKFSKYFNKMHPDDLEIEKIYLYSLLKLKNYKEIINYTKDKKNLSGIQTILEQAFLQLYKTGSKIRNFNLDSTLIDTVTGKDPYLFNEAFEITGNKGFKLDSGLLFLEKGEINKGNSVFQTMSQGDITNKKILFYTAIENGDFESALHILSIYDLGFDIQTLVQFKAELFVLTGRKANAYKTYLSIIDNYPKSSPVPYANLLWLWSKNKEFSIPSSINKGIEYFPDSEILRDNYLNFLILSNKKDEALKIINLYITKDPVLGLIKINLKGSYEPSYIIARIQEIMLKNPKQEDISKYYCWFLFYSGNVDMLDNFVKEFDKNNYPRWITPFLGIAAVYEKNYDQALTYFKKAYNYKNNWEYLFDTAILYENKNNLKKALDYFQRTELQLSRLPDPPSIDRSMVRYDASQILEKQGNIKGAINELEYALSLNSKNIAADLMLKRLKIKINNKDQE